MNAPDRAFKTPERFLLPDPPLGVFLFPESEQDVWHEQIGNENVSFTGFMTRDFGEDSFRIERSDDNPIVKNTSTSDRDCLGIAYEHRTEGFYRNFKKRQGAVDEKFDEGNCLK
jgi:hypothetical protein